MKSTALWVMTPRGLINRHRRSREMTFNDQAGLAVGPKISILDMRFFESWPGHWLTD
jgi:hypothetical protein